MKKLNPTFLLGTIGLLIIFVFSISYFFDPKPSKHEGFFSHQKNKYELFYKLFKNLDYKIKNYIYKLPEKDSLVIYFNYSKDQKIQLKELNKWVSDGGSLFLAGLDSEYSDFGKGSIAEKKMGKLKISKKISRHVKKIHIEQGKYLTGEHQGKILISFKKNPILVKKTMGKGNVYLLSEGDLLSKKHMKNENTAILFNNILKPYFKNNIYLLNYGFFEGTMKTPLQILFKGPLFFITIQLLIIGLIFIIWKGIRFGNAIPMEPFKRRSLTEHIRGVGLFYKKTNSINILTKTTSDYFKHEIYKILGYNSKVSEEKVVHTLCSRFNLNQSEVNRLMNINQNLTKSGLMNIEIDRNKLLNKIKGKNQGAFQ